MNALIKTLGLALLTFASSAVYAQKPQFKNNQLTPEQRTEMRAKRMARQMGLDSATTLRFTDTYRKYQAERRALRPQKPAAADKNTQAGKSQQPRQQLTEEQLQQRFKDNFERRQKALDLQKKYYKEFGKYLSQQQIASFYKMDENGMGRVKAPKGNLKKAGKLQHVKRAPGCHNQGCPQSQTCCGKAAKGHKKQGKKACAKACQGNCQQTCNAQSKACDGRCKAECQQACPNQDNAAGNR